MRSPEIERPAARVVSDSGNLQAVTRERSLVEDHPDSERVPARTVCAAFSLLVLGLVRKKEREKSGMFVRHVLLRKWSTT